jgi:hypothetical protein
LGNLVILAAYEVVNNELRMGKMKALGPLLTLICGILILVGLFMPWFAYSVPFSMFGESGNFDMSVSGWNFISHSGDAYNDLGSLLAMGFGSGSEWLVFIGGILITISALAAFLILLRSNGNKHVGVLFGAVALAGAVLAVVGTLKYIISDMDVLSSYSMGSELLGKGVYVSTAFAFAGALCAFIMFSQARSWGDLQLSNVMTSTSAPSGTVRDYYEGKAVSSAGVNTPVAAEPMAVPISPISITAQLPPLPPVIDDTAAQGCFARAGELEKAGERDKAIEEYTRAIRLNSRYTASYFQRGILLMGMGFKPAAVADFRRVMDIADNPELAAIAKEQMAKLG